MLLAFLIDQVLEMACPSSKQVFVKCCTRTAAWERLRSSFCAVVFDTTSDNCTATPSDSTPHTSPTILPDDQPEPELDHHHRDDRRPDVPCRLDRPETRLIGTQNPPIRPTKRRVKRLKTSISRTQIWKDRHQAKNETIRGLSVFTISKLTSCRLVFLTVCRW